MSGHFIEMTIRIRLFSHFRMINKELHEYVHYLVCDSKVIVCGLEGGPIMAFHADTVEQLYVG